jgi:hypothetical protein
LNVTHGLYVGIESQPRFTGEAGWLKSKVKDLSPAERKQGWTIAPVRFDPVTSTPAKDSSPVWLAIGAAMIVFLLFVLTNVFSVHF